MTFLVQTFSCPVRTKRLMGWFSWWKHPLPIKAVCATSKWESWSGQAGILQKVTAARLWTDYSELVPVPYGHMCLLTTVQRMIPMRTGPFVRNPVPIPPCLKLPHKTVLSKALHTFWWLLSWTKQFTKNLFVGGLSHFVCAPSENTILKHFITGMHSLT